MYPAHLMRVSDAEREAVVAQLSAATVDGRLTLDEFSDRTRQAYTARSWLQLSRLTLDLPAPRAAPAVPVVDPAPLGAGHGATLSWIAMLLGALSIVAVPLIAANVFAAVTAIVFGILGLRAADRGEPSHRGAAFAGVVCGLFGVLLTIAWTELLFVLF